MTAKPKTKTTKTKDSPIALFNPNDIELAITGSIAKNNLPEIKEAWTAWLTKYDAGALETDQDFVAAAAFVKDCKETEDILTTIEDKAIKGDIKKVLQDIREMREATRQKRLEFNRAVEDRKAKLKGDAVSAALKAVNDHVATLPYRWTAVDNVDIEGRLRAAIKGLSAFLKMNEALQAEAEKIKAEATEFSVQFLRNRGTVAEIYRNAGETATDSELDALVRTYGNTAPERAKFIIEQKKLARQQEELERQKAQPPQPAPAAAVPPPAPAPTAQAKTYRVGATFTTDSKEETTRRIESIGGSNVKFVDM